MNISRLEAAARQGQWSVIEDFISKASAKDLQKTDLVPLAKLARRSYRLKLAYKLLRNQVLIDNDEVNYNANPLALVEYATCLVMSGARKSALNILNHIKLDSAEVQFAWITLYFSDYSYDKALPHVQKYILQTEDPYLKLIGRLNQSACKVILADETGLQDELKSLRSEFQSASHKVLLANTYELGAQVELRNQNYSIAQKQLETAESILGEKDHLYAFFIEKWLKIAKAYQGQISPEDLKPLFSKANRLQIFNAKRDLLFHWGQIQKDETAMAKVFIGTSHKGYRDYLLRQNSHGDYYKKNTLAWNGRYFEHDYSSEIKVSRNTLGDLKLSKNEILLFSAFAEDFFEPKSVGTLFESVYKDEIFQPFYSTRKTYKLIERLKTKFDDAGFPIEVFNESGKYRLKYKDSIMIQLPNPTGLQQSSVPDLHLATKFRANNFTRKDVMEEFGLNKSATVRWLNRLIEEGAVQKVGQGPGSFYHFAS